MLHKSKSNGQRSFAYSIAWNLAGAGIPLCFAFFAIPRLLDGYGSARFGFLTIVWSLIGYFSIFDFGIGRALTKLVSERLGSGRSGDVPNITHTALLVMAVLGAIACITLVCSAPYLISLLRIDTDLYHESVISLRVLALGIPCVIISAGLIGLLEAHSRFQSINIIRLAMGLLNFGAPLLMLQWSPSLIPATIALTALRALTMVMYFSNIKSIGVLGSGSSFQREQLKELLGFGGWITVSNLISPLMAQLDKVVIGGIIAVSLLPFYSVPGDLVNRLSFVPIAMIGVFFPEYAARWASGKRAMIPSIYINSAKVMIMVMLPASLCIYALAPEGLSVWMGDDFSRQSTPLLRWLCIGLLVNAAARIPHAFLQAIGQPGITAKLHLLEFPIYGISLWWLLVHHGILGAAIAWTGRMALDFVLLSVCTGAIVPDLRRSASFTLIVVAIGCILISMSSFLDAMLLRLLLCAFISIICIPYALKILLRIKHHG